MELGNLYFGYVPAIIGTAFIVCSYLLLIRQAVFASIMLFILIFCINELALSLLILMFQGAMPNMLPHFLIFLSFPLLVVQFKRFS